MAFAFEVRESDLLGRLGTLKVGGKVLETPCLLPVIHPVSQAVSTGEMEALGFRGLMTNSYIIYSRRKEQALEDGIHRLIGFDGVLMTDSGGYQVLEYGELDLDYAQVAGFQGDIGSELAVTLDRPTGYPQSRAYARQTMEYSLRNAVSTLKEFGDRETTWVGPVQGGLFGDLVRTSARSLVGSGFEFLALGSPVQVMENYMFSDLVKMIVATRAAVPYATPLHLFGAGHPLTMALAVALGCDTFDSASYILFARNGRYMTRSGVLTLAGMKFLPCSCPVCAKTSVRGLMDLPHKDRTARVALHNLYVLREEMEACKEAITEGRLWDLVEEKSVCHPRLREAFREFSKHAPLLSRGTSLLKDRGLMVRSEEDVGRPEILTAGKRLRSVMRRASTTAVIQAQGDRTASGKGARKPSKAEGDVYRLHPVLGAYPIELDFVYPFTQTIAADDVPGKATLSEAVALLKRLGYARVKTAAVRAGAERRFRSKRNRRGASPSPPSS